MSATAWDMLKQDLRLTDREARVLTALLTGNPVARDGHEALVPLSSLLPDRSPPTTPQGQRKRDFVVNRDLEILFGLLRRVWHVESADGSLRGFSFVMSWTLADDSQFLRYLLNREVLVVLQDIRTARALEKLF
ncbi:hypothetical protein LMG22037_05983 [Paraburkholderia phenoliruptrix]|uniref:Uncharacterized protein n=1 Tax=Paraburkholderia phenoliruptrix TaxID=252970 RepID=A0A6J5CJA9_9BURK|nr:hypothetical protein [Paraburkholderia phenoliruptrix]CAB3735612.1 hypothetical protein LMG22037_05983 [Paraburkholderia phenoliruptrix]